mmetsp:Transcript_86922/g.150410  ORF Transcript_86922/g.150410 Transcript_86922/m.150410 type:complete len:277 (-) Transcript_86922:69-899(-)
MARTSSAGAGARIATSFRWRGQMSTSRPDRRCSRHCFAVCDIFSQRALRNRASKQRGILCALTHLHAESSPLQETSSVLPNSAWTLITLASRGRRCILSLLRGSLSFGLSSSHLRCLCAQNSAYHAIFPNTWRPVTTSPRSRACCGIRWSCAVAVFSLQQWRPKVDARNIHVHVLLKVGQHLLDIFLQSVLHSTLIGGGSSNCQCRGIDFGTRGCGNRVAPGWNRLLRYRPAQLRLWAPRRATAMRRVLHRSRPGRKCHPGRLRRSRACSTVARRN